MNYSFTCSKALQSLPMLRGDGIPVKKTDTYEADRIIFDWVCDTSVQVFLILPAVLHTLMFADKFFQEEPKTAIRWWINEKLLRGWWTFFSTAWMIKLKRVMQLFFMLNVWLHLLSKPEPTRKLFLSLKICQSDVFYLCLCNWITGAKIITLFIKRRESFFWLYSSSSCATPVTQREFKTLPKFSGEEARQHDRIPPRFD